MSQRTFYLKTLGCKVNQYETQGMREQLLRCGFCEVDSPEDACYVIVNSCTVTATSDRKTRYYLRRFKRLNPQSTVVVAGCYAEAHAEVIRMRKEADIVLNNAQKQSLVRQLGIAEKEKGIPYHAMPYGNDIPFAISYFKGRGRAFVKIQDGCGMACSYCKVRLVRPNCMSRSVYEIEEECRRLIDHGFKEIVLTGVQLGAFGRERGEDTALITLLDRMSTLGGLSRIRLSSIEPRDVSTRLIAYMAHNPIICRHLHIPLQSGDDAILMRMRRGYSRDYFLELIDAIRAAMADIEITTDVIVGFPGEDANAFEQTCDILRMIEPLRIHIFPFSPRAGTEACAFPDRVTSEEIHTRIRCLKSYQRNFFERRVCRMLGKIYPVLIEEQETKGHHSFIGRTSSYVRVRVVSERDVLGTVVMVRCVRMGADLLDGIIENERAHDASLSLI